ncbi:MAG: polysaccharide deacetylase family protein [Proteobacteria bacterium]|nr:polysaccharide deacetylase family protein [Pseudomonadota bacterium]
MTSVLLLLLSCAPSAPTSVHVPTAAPPTPAPIQVHLTIDDAPWMIQRGHNVPQSASDIGAKNQALIDVLEAKQVKTSVFFNCSRLQEGDGTLEAWKSAGHTLGNHTDTHAPLNKLGPTEWLQDASRCHEQLSEQVGQPIEWLRYPYLGYGDGLEARDAATAGLAVFGERTAPVTVATTEWLHAYVYRKALRLGDDELKQQVVEDYHQHMDAALAAAVEAAAEHPGRAVPQVVLIHLNELALDEAGPLIDRWQGRGIEFVDLPTAMADPLFAMENQYAGTAGLSWLWRIRSEEEYGRYWFGYEEGRVQERFGDIDPLDMGVPVP